MKPDKAVVEALVQHMLNSLEGDVPQFSASEFLSATFTLVSRASRACVDVSVTKPHTQRLVSDQFARLSLEFMPTDGTKQ